MGQPGGEHDGALPAEVQDHYASGYEAGRLDEGGDGGGRLELLRTRELCERYLPRPPAVVVDVGGGAGVYSLWLARKGYEVHLIDALPLHVELAREASARQPEAPLASAMVGDARRVERPDGSADATLLFGPLYHLTEREDRIAALREARRVVRAGGVVLAVGISRFASLIDGLFQGYLADPTFAEIVRGDLAEGQHRNPTGHPAYFTTAYFHRPEELGEELVAAGLEHEATLAVEGPAWHAKLVRERWDEAELRERVLEAVRWVEREPALLAASAHLLAVGRKA